MGEVSKSYRLCQLAEQTLVGERATVELLDLSTDRGIRARHLCARRNDRDAGAIDRCIGYYEPYVTSHVALDKDEAIQQEIRNAARLLLGTVACLRPK